MAYLNHHPFRDVIHTFEWRKFLSLAFSPQPQTHLLRTSKSLFSVTKNYAYNMYSLFIVIYLNFSSKPNHISYINIIRPASSWRCYIFQRMRYPLNVIDTSDCNLSFFILSFTRYDNINVFMIKSSNLEMSFKHHQKKRQ